MTPADLPPPPVRLDQIVSEAAHERPGAIEVRHFETAWLRGEHVAALRAVLAVALARAGADPTTSWTVMGGRESAAFTIALNHAGPPSPDDALAVSRDHAPLTISVEDRGDHTTLWISVPQSALVPAAPNAPAPAPHPAPHPAPAPALAPPKGEPPTQTAHTSEVAHDVRSFRWLMQDFAAHTPGVSETVAVSTAGRILAAASSADSDSGLAGDALGQLAGALASMTARAGEALRLGALESVLIEMNQAFLLVVPLGEAATVGVVADRRCDLASVAFEAARMRGHLLELYTRDVARELERTAA